ncbi:hypothetical protein JTP67_32225, partial [Streptomyces sp. S12]|nr:hypothetical protein [Streptomyces sp. S12]
MAATDGTLPGYRWVKGSDGSYFRVDNTTNQRVTAAQATGDVAKSDDIANAIRVDDIANAQRVTVRADPVPTG